MHQGHPEVGCDSKIPNGKVVADQWVLSRIIDDQRLVSVDDMLAK